MVVIMLVVSMMPLVLISGILRYYFNVSYQEKAVDHLKVLIKKHQQNIDRFLTLKLADLRIVSRLFPFEQLLEESFLKECLSTLQQEYPHSFVDLGIVNAQGVQVAYAGPFRLKEVDYSRADWFKKALKDESYISDVFPGLRGIPHFIVTTRVDYRGAKWIIRATVDFEAFNSLVDSIRIGKTGFAFIVNKKGEFQTKTRHEALASKGPYKSLIADQSLPEHDVTFLETTTDGGAPTIYVLAPLKNGEWFLVFQQEVSDAYAVVEKARWLSIIILVAGALAVGMVSVLLARRMVKKIKQSDQQKEMMNEQVIEAGKLASLGELAAGIAHEINNPVAIMVEEAGWMEDLLKDEQQGQLENAEEFVRALNQIKIQGRRCKEITHKLLSFARKTDPTVKNVNLNELIEDVVALSEQRAKYTGVKINLHLSDDIPTVNVSPSEIQQVMLNLINNALDAMEKTGGVIDITSRVNGRFVVVDVADNGPGIAKANLTRIFDPFYTTKPVGKGTGLGLSICYGIIKKMGGDITVNSAKGVGATFHVHIPWTQEQKAAS
ncbi:MAG: sensor histidine kinase [Desulfomonilaceae bacterium]